MNNKNEYKKIMTFFVKVFLLCLGITIIIYIINLIYAPLILKLVWIFMIYITKGVGVIILFFLFLKLYNIFESKQRLREQ